MTCIAAVAHEGKVWIGGDSAAMSQGVIYRVENGKVWRSGEFLFGVAGDLSPGITIRFTFTPPQIPDDDLDSYMATTFADELRASLKRRGRLEVENAVESVNCALLVGVRGALYHMDESFCMTPSLENYCAIGSGREVALGSLSETRRLEPERRIRRALERAEYWTDGVRAPFHIIHT